MTHRYGRHGNSAWLRWRQKRFRHTALTLVPHVAVLNVPLEFLRRIRKVTLLMADGTEQSVHLADFLPSPTVDADMDEKAGAILGGSLQSPRDRFFYAAKDTAREQAKKTYRSVINPYTTKPSTKEARSVAAAMYYAIENASSVLGWSSSETQEHFLDELRKEYCTEIEQIGVLNGVESLALQELLILARTDKVGDNGIPSLYAQERATIRAYTSFLSEGAEMAAILPLLRKRTEVYQRFYEEFEPAKEED